jgi:NTP pyrophosphatase (non-canonical NTP hydrolase)
MEIKELQNKIIEWGKERGLLNTTDSTKQLLYCMSEFGEVCKAIAKEDMEELKDGIGDTFVTITLAMKIDDEMFDLTNTEEQSCFSKKENAIANFLRTFYDLMYDKDYYLALIVRLNEIALHYNLKLSECVESAYNQIKNRKGKTTNGVFVKLEVNDEADKEIDKYLKSNIEGEKVFINKNNI